MRLIVVLASCVMHAAAFCTGPAWLALRSPPCGSTRGHQPILSWQGWWPPQKGAEEHGQVMMATARCVEPDDRAHLHPASRRQALRLACASLTSTWVGGPAAAFDNAVPEFSKYATKPKRRGDAPKDIGVLQRTVNADSLDADPRSFEGLRSCDGKCNCFSTTGDDLLEDRLQKGADTLIRPWLPPTDDPAPFKSLVAQVKAYEPGQGLVDGGGFRVVKVCVCV